MLLAGSLADACVVFGSGWDIRFLPYWNRRAQKQETQAAGGNLPILVGVGGIRKQASRKLLLIPGGFPALERAMNITLFYAEHYSPKRRLLKPNA
jgi:hypothetical protein